MNTKHWRIPLLVAFLIGVLALTVAWSGSTPTVLASHPAATPSGNLAVQIQPIGNPIWKPVDFHVFSAPIGTAADGYAEFFTTMQQLLPPPNHVFNATLGGIYPGAPHPPPYDSELANGVQANHFREGRVFRLSEFSNGNGVWLVFMTIPHPGTTGSSPDFASGPIIPNTLFPIHTVGVSYHNGAVFDPFLAPPFDVPPLDSNFNPPYNVDGHSHFPEFLADNTDFGPAGAKPLGSYTYHFKMTDQQGNGWTIVARFAVKADSLGSGQ